MIFKRNKWFYLKLKAASFKFVLPAVSFSFCSSLRIFLSSVAPALHSFLPVRLSTCRTGNLLPHFQCWKLSNELLRSWKKKRCFDCLRFLIYTQAFIANNWWRLQGIKASLSPLTKTLILDSFFFSCAPPQHTVDPVFSWLNVSRSNLYRLLIFVLSVIHISSRLFSIVTVVATCCLHSLCVGSCRRCSDFGSNDGYHPRIPSALPPSPSPPLSLSSPHSYLERDKINCWRWVRTICQSDEQLSACTYRLFFWPLHDLSTMWFFLLPSFAPRIGRCSLYPQCSWPHFLEIKAHLLESQRDFLPRQLPWSDRMYLPVRRYTS